MVRLYFSLHDDDDDESQSSGLCLCSLSMCMLRVLLCQQKSLFSLALSIGLRVCERASSVSIHNVLWVMHAHRVKYDTIHGLLGCCCVRVFLFLIWLLLLRLHPHQCQTKMRSMLAHEFHLHSMCCTMSYPPWVLHCSLARMYVWCHYRCRRRRSNQSGAEKEEKQQQQQPCIEMKIWTQLNFHAPPNRALCVNRRLLNNSREREREIEKVTLEFMVFFSDKVSKWPMSLCANDGCSAQHTHKHIHRESKCRRHHQRCVSFFAIGFICWRYFFLFILFFCIVSAVST